MLNLSFASDQLEAACQRLIHICNFFLEKNVVCVTDKEAVVQCEARIKSERKQQNEKVNIAFVLSRSKTTLCFKKWQFFLLIFCFNPPPYVIISAE